MTASGVAAEIPLEMQVRREQSIPVRTPPFGLSTPVEDLICAAVFAFFAMQGAIPGIAPAQAHEMTGSAPTPVSTIGGIASQVVVNGSMVLLMVRHARLVLRNLLAVPGVALLGALAIASAVWSLDPLLTLRRSVPFALTGMFGLWFAARFPLRRQLRILQIAMIGLALGTIAMVLFVPAAGLDHSPGHGTDWQGLFTQKNACGRMMVLATAVILFGERITVRRTFALGLFALVLIMSGSRGAWMVEAALLVLWIFVRTGARCSRRGRILMAVAAPAALAVAAVPGVLLLPRMIALLGRDPTLSGRTLIWREVFGFLLRRPWLGYGYDAFWQGMRGPSLQVDAAVHFVVEHAHNGFLEISLELGLAGLGLMVLSWMGGWRQLWAQWRDGEPVGYSMAILVLVALYSLDENTLLIYNGLLWPLYVAALAGIAFTARDRRHRAPPAVGAMLGTEVDGTPRIVS